MGVGALNKNMFLADPGFLTLECCLFMAVPLYSTGVLWIHN